MEQLVRRFGAYLPMLLVAAPIVLAMSFAAVWARDGFTRRSGLARRAVLDGLLFLWACATVAITLMPGMPGGGGRPVELVPFAGIVSLVTRSVDVSVPVAQIGGNLLLFAALGLLGGLRCGWRTARCALAATALAVVIEVLQYAQGAGRVASVDDVLLAAAGGAIGGAAARMARAWARRLRGDQAVTPTVPAGEMTS